MKLIIINWPCWVWKSTLSSQLFKKYPLSVYINIDDLRRNISGYKESAEKSLSLVLNMAYALLETALKNWNTVILDKMIYENISYGIWKNNILNKYIQLAQKHNAEVSEFILWAEWDIIKIRCLERGFSVDSSFTMDKAELFWKEIKKFKNIRKNVILINTGYLSKKEIYEYVSNQIR